MGVCKMKVKRTRLCRSCNPVTPVECVSLTFRTHPCVLAFITHISCINGIEMALVWLIDILCVIYIFSILNLLHCLDESWWNMPFKGDDAVAMLLSLWLHAAALWRHTVWTRIVTSHNAWMGYEYSLPNLNRPRAIHHNPMHKSSPPRNNGACVIINQSILVKGAADKITSS